jgi:hypothetical protein
MSIQSARKKMVEELEQGRARLLSDPSSRQLLLALRHGLQSITRNIYIFQSIPEQLEDLYDVLVDATTVVHIGLPRDSLGGGVILEKWSVEEYRNSRKSLSKSTRRRLEAALELAQARRTKHRER